MFSRDYALNRIYVKGEVSNCKYHTSGHIYFTLKDASGQMACVMFAGQRSGLGFRLQEGQSVVVLGSISVYERDGKYQLYAREILLDGAGVLYQKFEVMKKQLESEGLFDGAHKKPIMQYPRKIGIVTAKTGAAIQDMIQVTSRRNPYLQLVLYPALVQGTAAAPSIIKGISVLDTYGVDTIIVGRGGGSIEDLWAFNEESVARAIYACKTPIISAVGHETDTTIADYVADLRAPTPSAAAELVTGDIRDLLDDLQAYQRTFQFHMRQKIQLARNQVQRYGMQLEHTSPINQINSRRQDLIERENRLQSLMQQRLLAKRHQLELYAQRMKGVSPLEKLNKGYAVVMDEKKQIVRSIEQVAKGDSITIAMLDGEVNATVESTMTRRRE